MAGPASRKPAPTIRPKFNVFSLLDHMTGRYVRGKHGAWYMNGGFSHITGWAGRGNTYKSTASGVAMATVSLRYKVEYTEWDDTELSLEASRIADYVNCALFNNPHLPHMELKDLYASEESRWMHTSSDQQSGDEWWRDTIRAEIPGRKKIPASKLRVTPMYEMDGSYRAMQNPWLFNVDSFSEFRVSAVEEMYAKGDVGESELNTESLKDAGSKAQLMKQMPLVAATGGYYFSLIAHADDHIQMDKYEPNQRKLAGLKGNLKLKGVPGRQFSFLPNNLFIATSTGSLLDNDKMPEYPHPESEPTKGDSDLQIVRFEQLRGKSGPTGGVLDLIFSQKEGLLVGLTEFHYLRVLCKYWGMEIKGNNQGFKLDIYPEVFFTRRTIRQIIRNDPKFARALSITAACAYMKANWFNMDRSLLCDMKTLYEGIKTAGYDWDEILADTVEYWYFQDQEKEIGKPTLTAMTLLEMHAGKHKAKYLKKHP